MNKLMLLGRLTKKPEIRLTQANNTKVASFTLAVNRKYVKEGEERQTDFINIIAYAKLAEFVEKYLDKGIQICLTGRIQTRVWDDANGQKRYATEIIAEEIDFADSNKKENSNLSNVFGGPSEPIPTNVESSLETDDLPF